MQDNGPWRLILDTTDLAQVYSRVWPGSSWIRSGWDALVQQNHHSEIRGELMWASRLRLTFNQPCLSDYRLQRCMRTRSSLGMIKLVSTLPSTVIFSVPSPFPPSPNIKSIKKQSASLFVIPSKDPLPPTSVTCFQWIHHRDGPIRDGSVTVSFLISLCGLCLSLAEQHRLIAWIQFEPAALMASQKLDRNKKIHRSISFCLVFCGVPPAIGCNQWAPWWTTHTPAPLLQ